MQCQVNKNRENQAVVIHVREAASTKISHNGKAVPPEHLFGFVGIFGVLREQLHVTPGPATYLAQCHGNGVQNTTEAFGSDVVPTWQVGAVVCLFWACGLFLYQTPIFLEPNMRLPNVIRQQSMYIGTHHTCQIGDSTSNMWFAISTVVPLIKRTVKNLPFQNLRVAPRC